MSSDDALVDLLEELKARDYRFTCVTPATHQVVFNRPFSGEPSLRDIFGWNRWFRQGELEPPLQALLQHAGCIESRGGLLRSLVRVASVGRHLLLHSAFPTSAADAVFLGPDTYRFIRFIGERLPELGAASWIVDMGAGSGAGGIAAADLLPSARLTLVDVNPAAAKLARINAESAGIEADVIVADRIPEGCDVILANPPYMIDVSHRTYRDGGTLWGGGISLEWVRQALAALSPHGSMLLYTGAAFVGGRAPLVAKIAKLCDTARAELHVAEVDPDVFGGELARPEYSEVERIAALTMVIRRR